MRKRFKALIAIRNDFQVLRTGEYVPIYAEGRQLAFVRHLEKQVFLVAINAGDSSWELNIPVNEYFSDGTPLRDLLGGDDALVSEGHLREMKISPWEGAIFKVQDLFESSSGLVVNKIERAIPDIHAW